MAVHNGLVGGGTVLGSLTSKKKEVNIYSSGTIKTVNSVNGREIVFSVGAQIPHSKEVNIYSYGTLSSDRIDSFSGFISNEYIHNGFYTNTNEYDYVPSKVVIEYIRDLISSRGSSIISTLRGFKTLEKDVGLDHVIKVLINPPKSGLPGRALGDCSHDVSGAYRTIRPRRYPDTHIPRRRDD